MVCEFNWCQAPALRGVTGGRSRPSTLVTGFEKVSVILVLGVIFVPGAGIATAVALVPAGNHEIVLTVGISQLRAATATAPVPALARALRARLVEAAEAGLRDRGVEADGHRLPAPTRQEGRGEPRHGRRLGDPDLLVLARQPGDPARTPDGGLDGDALAGGQPVHRHDLVADQPHGDDL